MSLLAAPVSVVAAYRFVDVPDAAALRQRWLDVAQRLQLTGTVLLAPEGANMALAGSEMALHAWFHTLAQNPRWADLEVKWQAAERAPFKHLRVKLKREIIRMNQPAVRPACGRAPGVDAATLARWLQAGRCDEGRPVALLDTRNAFEVDAGAFKGALDWRLSKFSEFPAALAAHADELANKTVVSYCTGGIRCEKAALWMAHCGLPHVLQLDGGILRYFEDLPGAPHWHGRCVVFDGREALHTDLSEARA